MRYRYTLIIISLLMVGCVKAPLYSPAPSPALAPIATKSYLEQGKRYFEKGYYRRALRELLPLACDGNAEAQYAVGYMYYYGYGVAQDTDVGYFWIRRAADQGFQPANQALVLLSKKVNKLPSLRDEKRYGR